jgi:hypothetical protein
VVRRYTTVNVETVLVVILEDIRIWDNLASNAKVSEFPEFQHQGQRNFAVQYYGCILYFYGTLFFKVLHFFSV